MSKEPAVLVLENGDIYRGQAWGARGEAFGELVFSTGMTGYQETLTDPSYYRQIVVMTAPHIGNTGVNDEDNESRRIWVSGFVSRDPARYVALMPLCILEKLSFGVPAPIFYFRGQTDLNMALGGAADLVLAVFFFVAWRKTLRAG